MVDKLLSFNKMGNCRGKVSYPNKKIAQTILNSRKYSHNGVPLRIYNCDICGKWHLTKQPMTNFYEQKRSNKSYTRFSKRKGRNGV